MSDAFYRFIEDKQEGLFKGPYISLKTPFISATAEESAEAYFALPYNPAGEGELYKSAHVIPYKLFDMDNDNNVLIGKSLWDKIGADSNTYNELLDIFDKVGEEYIAKIRNEYFGIK